MNSDPVLIQKDDGLYLEGDGLSIHGDYTKLVKRLKPQRVCEELLVKAVKIKDFKGRLNVVDATAGLGEDSLILAAAGFRVMLIERDGTIFKLLEDTVKRARSCRELEETVSRMTLVEGDSKEILAKLSDSPDVVFLDPMFPKRDKSGLIKKKFQLIQSLEAPCDEEEALLNAAISAGPRKVVVKRPKNGPNLAGKKPSYSLMGNAIRYDVYTLNK